MPIIVSVIIASYNREKFIVAALQSLYNQTADKAAFEVIVVDNNSQDNTTAICNAYITAHPAMQTRYVTELQQGASFARNTGAAMANGSILFFMDDDAVAEPDLIEQTIAFHNKYPAIYGWGGKITPHYIPAAPVWMSHYVASLVGNFDYGQEILPFAANKYPLESNMAVLVTAFKKVNGFNTALPGVKGTLRIGGEGKEFFFKIKALGSPIYYTPFMKVKHTVETEKLTPEYMYRVASGIGRGERIRVKQKGAIAVLIKCIEYLYKLAGAVVIGLFYCIQGKSEKFWPVVQFRIDALKGFLDRNYLN
jgi:glycosyltransferase involved in cell wall biosynthesis